METHCYVTGNVFALMSVQLNVDCFYFDYTPKSADVLITFIGLIPKYSTLASKN